MDDAGDAIAFGWSRPRLKWMAGLMVLIGALGIPLLLAPDPGARILGCVWIGLFGWAVWALLRRLADREPVLVLTAEGLRDRRISDALIPWSAIARIEALDAEHVPFIGLEFRDARATLAGARSLVRLMAPVQRLFFFPSASIQMSLLDGSREDVLAAVARLAPAVEIAAG